MNVQLRQTARTSDAASKLAVADCDLHLGPASVAELYPFMERRWRDHIETFGISHRTGMQGGLPSYPKAQPNAARRDAWPPSGRPPGTDLDFIRSQHLDAYNVTLGLINPPTPSNAALNPDLANALAGAMNDFQAECLVSPEPRLRASVVVNYEDAPAAVAEIERRANDKRFGHVLLFGRTGEPMGSRRYRPIFEAAVAAGLPVAVHAFGFGGKPNTSSGWASFYMEDMVGHAQSLQAQLASMVIEGVFTQLPSLRFVLIEGGFGWVPSLSWRLDKHWSRLKAETPHLDRLPSEIIRSQVWFTTQPMEEPENRQHLADCIEWIGWDRLLFASDYPHWDFDDPMTSMPLRLTEAQRTAFYRGNAEAIYGAG
ncbi:MAG TPA: amidohydrolase family protein [Acetobacteraceae bacterium]